VRTYVFRVAKANYGTLVVLKDGTELRVAKGSIRVAVWVNCECVFELAEDLGSLRGNSDFEQ
jgi:hypothetical protein